MPFLDPGNTKHVHAEERLRSELVAWLTTVSAEGQPQSSPVWFHWDGETFLLFSQPDRPKLHNISSDPKVSLHLEGGDEGEDVVSFEGRAEVAARALAATAIPEYIEKYRSLIAGYGWTPESFATDYSVPVRVTPTRLRVD